MPGMKRACEAMQYYGPEAIIQFFMFVFLLMLYGVSWEANFYMCKSNLFKCQQQQQQQQHHSSHHHQHQQQPQHDHSKLLGGLGDKMGVPGADLLKAVSKVPT